MEAIEMTNISVNSLDYNDVFFYYSTNYKDYIKITINTSEPKEISVPKRSFVMLVYPGDGVSHSRQGDLYFIGSTSDFNDPYIGIFIDDQNLLSQTRAVGSYRGNVYFVKGEGGLTVN